MKIDGVKKKILIHLLMIPFLALVYTLIANNGDDRYTMALAIVSVFFFFAFAILLLVSQNSLVNAEDELKSVLDAAAEGIYGIDREGKCTFANPSCVRMLGYRREKDLIGKDMHSLIHHSHMDGSSYPVEECKINRSLEKGQEFHCDNEVFWNSRGDFFQVEYRVKPRFVRGRFAGSVITFMDITDRKKSEDHIKYLSYHDPVTGLYNQTFMYEEMKRLDVKRNLPFSVIVGDINGLKLINDVFGHKSGDELIERMGQVIRNSCRADDIIARTGGDEFAILLPNTSTENARVVLDRIAKAAVEVKHKAIRGSISLGLATKTEPNEDIVTVLSEAEEKMYLNKNLNNNENQIGLLEDIIARLHDRSEREKQHSKNVSEMCEKIALNLGLEQEDIRRVKVAGYYHDIGKIALEDNILLNLGNLDKVQHSEMKRHTIVGFRILNLFTDTMDLAKGALDHHELWNGKGYPKGLIKDDISLLGRIIGLAEAYDFYTNPLSKGRCPVDEAIRRIREDSGVRYDPDVVTAFLKTVKD